MCQKKISVCMAAYNGQKYIIDQLISIYRQSREPDEVVICDDNSQDNTVSLIQGFITEHHLEEKWHLYCNTASKGYPGNFYYAMSLCKGDVIFLADQDDVWEFDKIEIMSQTICKDENILLLASAWRAIDKHGVITGKTKSSNLKVERISVKRILYKYLWPGMSMCYTREFGQRVLEKVQHTKLAHDITLALCAAEEEGFTGINTCLQYHRNHDENVSIEEHGLWKRLNKKRKLVEIQRYLDMLEEILNNPILLQLKNIDLILYKREIMQERFQNLKQGRVFRIIRQYWKNREAVRISTMICDCLICRRKVDTDI